MFDTDRFRKAIDLALDLHGEQPRKGSEVPYMGHLLGVTSIVIDDGGSESEVLAALLHDGPEDAGGEKTLARIRAEFGDEVAEIVAHLSDTFEDPKPPWRARKEAYLADLKALPTDDFGRKVLRVSLADKLHNVRSILLDSHEAGEEIWDRFTGGEEGSLWYYQSLADIYEEKLGETALVLEFIDTVAELGPWPGRIQIIP
ncbi:MAG: HD domain-containing protein [Solirubrobacterales bacterium]|nr:HD domain-containing protein [Solirubrobacterales bacterium]HMT06315.1 HD domain-containing protein [Solirubrobacterales bacterium]